MAEITSCMLQEVSDNVSRLGLGKPSAGKSTFFKAATLAETEIASYPFTTIKANRGVGYVKVECIESEFDVKCQPAHGFCLNGERFVPVELIDVAGLVPGASEGKGLGNQFLDDLRQADVFIHIVDASGRTDSEGKPAESYNVEKDIEFLEEELNKWYFNIMMKVWKTFSKQAETESKDSDKRNFAKAVANQFSGLKVKEEYVKEVLRDLEFKDKESSSRWNESQVFEFASKLRKVSKPTIIAANKIDLKDSEENYRRIKERFGKEGFLVIPCIADFELALREASKKDLIDYIPGEKTFEIKKDKELSEEQKEALGSIKKNLSKFEYGTGVQEVLNTAVFKLLNYITVFPVDSASKLTDGEGRVLPDCFLLPKGSTALDLAYFLHTDFGDNFIKAIDARSKRALGKSYELKHRDALEIVTR